MRPFSSESQVDDDKRNLLISLWKGIQRCVGRQQKGVMIMT
jgi:hypothetical protein